MSIEHVYVHVPFCARKCPYCDFNSHAGRDGEIDAYLDALLKEASVHARGLKPRTVFVGGGTPTHPNEEQLDRYLAGLASILDLSAVEEFTVEANPGTFTPGKIRALRRNGVDRVSLGVQSFDDRRLKILGRIHDAGDAVRSVAMLREGGMPRVSLDLILSTPGQTLGEQRRDVARAIALAPDHVSTYVLTFEEGTAFTKSLAEGRLPEPDDERDLMHLHEACAQLGDAGYRRYEVSNHAKPGEESLHNLGYWRNREWLGLGAGAHSHVAGARWKNEDDPAGYARGVQKTGAARVFEERVDAKSALLESMMMGLRLIDEGVDLAELAARHGVDPRVEHAEAIARRLVDGTLVREGDRLRATARGIDVLNTILVDFVPTPA